MWVSCCNHSCQVGRNGTTVGSSLAERSRLRYTDESKEPIATSAYLTVVLVLEWFYEITNTALQVLYYRFYIILEQLIFV